MTSPEQLVCRCGHPRAAHQHHRRGSDCAICGAQECAGFRGPAGAVLTSVLLRGVAAVRDRRRRPRRGSEGVLLEIPATGVRAAAGSVAAGSGPPVDSGAIDPDAMDPGSIAKQA